MKTFLSILTIIMIAAPFAHAADPADDSLILYLSFNELNVMNSMAIRSPITHNTVTTAPSLAHPN